MMFKSSALYVFTFIASVVSLKGLGLHLATKGLIQVHPSFSGKGIKLFPALRPGHNASDLEHLVPKLHDELYYSQEGHRPSLHGAKHGSMKANFTRPTIILDHSSHLRSIKCSSEGHQGQISICLSPDGFKQAQETWTLGSFHLVTFHIGCGDESTGARTYYLAKNPQFDLQTDCVDVATTLITQEVAVDSGEITWGTYENPELKKRGIAVKGHVRVSKEFDEPFYARGPVAQEPKPKTLFKESAGGNLPVFRRQDNGTWNITLSPFGDQGNGTLDEGAYVDITKNATALQAFFDWLNFDISNMSQSVPPGDDLNFIEMDGEVGTWDEEGLGLLRREGLHRLEDRGIVEFFQGIYNGIKEFVRGIINWFMIVVARITDVGETLLKLAVLAAKVILVPFGVPFDESYHNDFNFTKVLKGDATNKPPTIFGYTDGFNLASSGGVFSVQCAKCGIHGDFSVEGRLAFSIQDGITEGYAALVNNDAFTIDAVFGVTLLAQYDKPIKSLEKQLATVPLSPLTIPGIITLGPQISVSAGLNLVVSGKASFVIGGSLSIDKGNAKLSLVKKSDNAFDGFQTTFSPVAKFQKDGLVFTASVELGLPIALEVGLDVLNGKFKKSVGLVNKPSVYGAAALNLETDLLCNNGITLSVGVKNSIYVAAIDLWDYTIRTDILYEKALACVTASGFNSSIAVEDPVVFTTVPTVVGEDIANNPPNITDISRNLTNPKKSGEGFRIVMDQNKSSILVSGRDGYVYLVDTEEEYDTSSPWGSVDLSTDSLSLDVFGRILSWLPDDLFKLVAEIKVWTPTKIPANYKTASLSILKTTDKTFTNYGIAVVYNGRNTTYYPTFCKSPQGLRLWGFYYALDANGNIDSEIPSDYQGHLTAGAKRFNITNVASDCRTVQLTSV